MRGQFNFVILNNGCQRHTRECCTCAVSRRQPGEHGGKPCLWGTLPGHQFMSHMAQAVGRGTLKALYSRDTLQSDGGSSLPMDCAWTSPVSRHTLGGARGIKSTVLQAPGVVCPLPFDSLWGFSNLLSESRLLALLPSLPPARPCVPDQCPTSFIPVSLPLHPTLPFSEPDHSSSSRLLALLPGRPSPHVQLLQELCPGRHCAQPRDINSTR